MTGWDFGDFDSSILLLNGKSWFKTCKLRGRRFKILTAGGCTFRGGVGIVASRQGDSSQIQLIA